MNPVIVVEVPHRSKASGYIAYKESDLPEDTHDLYSCHLIGPEDVRDFLRVRDEHGCERRHQADRIAALVDDFSIILGWRVKGS